MTIYSTPTIAISLIIITHMYLFNKYKTLSPCDAASKRILKYEFGKPGNGAGTLAKLGLYATRTEDIPLNTIRSIMDNKTILYCYSVALGITSLK